MAVGTVVGVSSTEFQLSTVNGERSFQLKQVADAQQLRERAESATAKPESDINIIFEDYFEGQSSESNFDLDN